MSLLNQQFMEAAFFHLGGKLVFQSKMRLNSDLAWFQVFTYDYNSDWWKPYLNTVFLAKMVFHRGILEQRDIWYLYEVYPVHVNERGYARHGKSIRGSCVSYLNEAYNVPAMRCGNVLDRL